MSQQISLAGGTSGSVADNPIFVYEVEGLRQNDQTDGNAYPVRNSSTVLLQVPYNRMNDAMRRISRMGGKIVGIHALGATPAAAAEG